MHKKNFGKKALSAFLPKQISLAEQRRLCFCFGGYVDKAATLFALSEDNGTIN
jgi:hypothetical protein